MFAERDSGLPGVKSQVWGGSPGSGRGGGQRTHSFNKVIVCQAALGGRKTDWSPAWSSQLGQETDWSPGGHCGVGQEGDGGSREEGGHGPEDCMEVYQARRLKEARWLVPGHRRGGSCLPDCGHHAPSGPDAAPGLERFQFLN